MTKKEKILREAIRKEIRKELNEFSPKDLKKSLGRGAQKVTGALRTKFGQLGKVLEPMKARLKSMSSTQKIDFISFLIGDVAQLDKKEFDVLRQRISRQLGKSGSGPSPADN